MRKVSRRQVEGAFIKAIRKRSTLYLLFALTLAACYAYQHPGITGSTRVHDGDTLTVSGEKFRLLAVDAFELDQTCTRDGKAWACGKEAKEHLAQLISGNQVSCTGSKKSYDRIVATCSVAGLDLGAEMVRAGYALAYRKFGSQYVPLEKQAQQDRSGAWSGSFDPPWSWRANH